MKTLDEGVTGVCGIDMDSEESTGEEVVRGRNEYVEVDVWCYEDGQNRE